MSLTLSLPPLAKVAVGDCIRFSLFCFGAKRSAIGLVVPSSCTIPNVVQVDFRVALPPVADLAAIYHASYPDDGKFTGSVQIPLDDVEEVGQQLNLLEDSVEPEFTLDPLPQTRPQPQAEAKSRKPATGWIEQRTGNKSRQNPSLSYYYCYEQAGARTKHYIPARKVCHIQTLVADRKSVDDVLAALAPAKKKGVHDG